MKDFQDLILDGTKLAGMQIELKHGRMARELHL